MFNHIEQGRRLKKEDQRPGSIPFVMSGTTNQGVIGYISNPVTSFPANAITVDIFGNTFYRSYAFGAGDDTGVYWSDIENYSSSTMLFFSAAIGKSLKGRYSYGNKLRSSQSHDFKISLPINSSGEIDFVLIEEFLRELEESRLRELEAYLLVTGLNDYELRDEDQRILDNFKSLHWKEYDVIKVFDVKNTHNILSSEVQPNSGIVPYLCASAENNGVCAYISYNDNLKETGKCIFIGGKTFVVSYQSDDFFSNDSHNLALYFKATRPNRFQYLFMAACIYKGLGHKYTWGDSISKAKIKRDTLMLPANIDGEPDLEIMERIITIVQKMVIADVAKYTFRRLEATRSVVEQSEGATVIEMHPYSKSYSEIKFKPIMAAEPFECYNWNRFDQQIINFFGGDKTVLVGCSKNKKHHEWILSHKIYNVRLGNTKGSMQKYQNMFGQTSLLVLYDFKNPDKLSAYSIKGNKEMTKQEMLQMGYPNPQRNRYMTFLITPIEMDLTLIENQHLIEKLIGMNPTKDKGTPAFIEP